MRHVLASLFIGASVGFLGVVVTGLALDLALDSTLIPLTLPGGIAGGLAMGLFAAFCRASGIVRFTGLAFVALPAIFFAELVTLYSLGFDEVAPGSSLTGAALTMLVAMPGILAGAAAVQALVRHDTASRARIADLRRAFADTTAEPAALRALDDGSEAVRSVAIRWLAIHHPDAVDRLRVHLSRVDDHETVARELAELDTHGDPRTDGAETLLLEILDQGGWNAQRAAIRSLGQVGGGRSMEPLQKLIAIDYLALEARAAIRRIRPRLPNAARGHVSVASSSEASGSLSVPAQPGALSKPS